jgi:hypothetical protein
MKIVLLSWLLGLCTPVFAQSLQQELVGIWVGPTWSEILRQPAAGSVDPERDFGPFTFRFELKDGALVGTAATQSASVDKQKRAWLYPPREVPIDEITVEGKTVWFKFAQGTGWLRFKMSVIGPDSADVVNVSAYMRGHGEIPSRNNRLTSMRRVSPLR